MVEKYAPNPIQPIPVEIPSVELMQVGGTDSKKSLESFDKRSQVLGEEKAKVDAFAKSLNGINFRYRSYNFEIKTTDREGTPVLSINVSDRRHKDERYVAESKFVVKDGELQLRFRVKSEDGKTVIGEGLLAKDARGVLNGSFRVSEEYMRRLKDAHEKWVKKDLVGETIPMEFREQDGKKTKVNVRIAYDEAEGGKYDDGVSLRGEVVDEKGMPIDGYYVGWRITGTEKKPEVTLTLSKKQPDGNYYVGRRETLTWVPDESPDNVKGKRK